MPARGRDYTRIHRTVVLTVLVVITCVRAASAQDAPCTPERRREAVRSMQAEVLGLAPNRLDSLVKAIEPGGPLAGWIMSHGHIVLAHGAVPVGNIRATSPWPHLLLFLGPGGLSLPEEAFFRLVNGRRQPISKPK
jgi:hypothetical protein